MLGSLSRMKYRGAPALAAPHRLTIDWTHCCWNAELLATLASFGSLFVIGWFVDFKMPFPASGNHWASLPVCAPYLACEKPASLLRFEPSFATQSSMGM